MADPHWPALVRAYAAITTAAADMGLTIGARLNPRSPSLSVTGAPSSSRYWMLAVPSGPGIRLHITRDVYTVSANDSVALLGAIASAALGCQERARTRSARGTWNALYRAASRAREIEADARRRGRTVPVVEVFYDAFAGNRDGLPWTVTDDTSEVISRYGRREVAEEVARVMRLGHAAEARAMDEALVEYAAEVTRG